MRTMQDSNPVIRANLPNNKETRKNRRKRMGELCPCGSGKKYKNCHFVNEDKVRRAIAKKREERLKAAQNAAMVITPTELVESAD